MAIEVERLKPLLGRKGTSRSTHYAEIAAGLWTPGVRLGRRAVGWPRHESDAILAARVAGKSEPEIRELVSRLAASRANAA